MSQQVEVYEGEVIGGEQCGRGMCWRTDGSLCVLLLLQLLLFRLLFLLLLLLLLLPLLLLTIFIQILWPVGFTGSQRHRVFNMS
jgi:hypothetical protein